jgi:hypothetical protein
MTFTLTAENFEFETNHHDDEDFNIVPVIKLECYFNDTVLFTFLPEMGCKSKTWENLADACRSGSSCAKDWVPSNGEAYICIREGLASFEIAKYGDGQGGSLVISIPAESCISGFEEAAKITTEWLSKSKV